MAIQISNPWDSEYLQNKQSPIYVPLWEKLKKFLKNHQQNKSILDYGCGDGNYSILIKDLGFNVMGIDISSNAIEIAKKSTITQNILFKTANSIPDSIYNDSFDAIVMLNVLHCISNKDRVKLLKKARKVLKDKGYLFASILSVRDESLPRNEWFEVESNTFNDGTDKLFHFFTLDEIKKELEGFNILETEILENIHPDIGKKSSLYIIIAQNEKYNNS